MNLLLNNFSAVLNDIGRWFCNYGIDIFIQSGILIILLLIVDFLLRKRLRATIRYWIWMLVLLKLMLPPAFSLPTGIGRWFGDYIPAQTSISQQVSNTARHKPAGASAPQDPSFSGEIPQVHLSQASPEPAAPALPAISDSQALTWQAVVFIVWFTGAAVLSVLLVHRILFVRRLIAQSEPAKSRHADMLDQCRQKLGIKRKTELRLSRKLQSPAVCGFFRPVILIPTGLLDNLLPEKLRAVLIHELAHIKRGDLWVNCLQTFLQIIHFYNPLVWLANAIIHRIREQAVDEMVLVALGAGAKSYSNTLIDIAEMTLLKTSLSLRLIGVVESKKALSRRIKHILNRPIPKNAKLGALGFVVVILSAAVLLPMAKAQKQDPDIVETEQINSRFTATLPDGVKVKLVGICEHPSEGKYWWRPDGSLLEKNLYRLHWGVRTGRENYKGFEVVISVYGTTDTPGIVTYDIGSGFNSLDKAGGIWATIIHVPEKVKATDINLGIATGQWITVHEAGREGMSFASGQNGSYGFSVPFEEEGYLGIVVTHNLDTKNENFRIIAVDRSGQIHTSGHPAGGSMGEWSQYSARFKGLKSSDVNVFKLQTRTYGRVTFRNVSLQPNMKTAVQIENVGERETRISIRGQEINVLKGENGPDVVVRKKLPPEGTAYYKKFDKEYLLKIVTKSYGQNITETVGRETSGETSGPKFVQKRIGFGIPFAIKEVDRLRKKREFQKQLRENIKKDINDILGVTAGGGGTSDLQHLEYLAGKVVGSINIHYSQNDEDILQFQFSIYEVVIAENKTDVLRVPSDRYPTIQSAVQAANEGDKIVLDPSVTKDDVPEQIKPDVQTEERRELRTILLPDVDSKDLMLDLASGELVKVPKEDTLEDMSLAIDKLNKGDLIFDASSLILVRGATAGSLPDTAEPFNTYRIGSRLPEIFNLKTREGIEWTIEIHSMDKNGCRLQYYPVHPNHYISAIPLTTMEHDFIRQVLELVKQVEEKYPSQATHWPEGPGLYHVDAQGDVTVWHYQKLWHRNTDCAEDEVGYGSSQLVKATCMYYLPDGTPLQSRWRERGGGMKDIRVKIGRTVNEDERVGLVHRHELSSDNDLYSRDGRERKIMLHSWNSSPLAIIVRIDRPLCLFSWALGDVEEDVQHFDEYDQLLVTGPPVDNPAPMLVTIQLP